MNDTTHRPAQSLFNDHLRWFKLRKMITPNIQEGGKMFGLEGEMLQRVAGIDKSIAEEFLERSSYEHVVLPERRKCLKGKVMIQEEEQAKEEAENKREGLVLWTDGTRTND